MRSFFRRLFVTIGAAVVLVVAVGGVASATGTVVLTWSPSGTYSYPTLTAGQSASQGFKLTNSGSSETDTATLTATGSSLKATADVTLKGAAAKASPALATSPSAGGTVGSATVKDTATLTGGYNPTGTITFNLYAPGDTSCSGSPVDTETVTVSGNGTYATPTGYTPTATGTYRWIASYGGDGNNNTAATACADEPVIIRTCVVLDTSSKHDYASLQGAVDAAAAGDTLTVRGSCTGTTTIGKDLTVTGQQPSGYPTPTLDGNRAGPVVTISQGATVTINTLTVTGGLASRCCGGGISNSGTLTVNGVTVTGNTTIGSDGGGIGNFGSLTLNNTTVSGNSAPGGGSGGGVWSDATLILNGDTTISGNDATEGGGMEIAGGTATLNDSSLITGNSATGDGGGSTNFGGATLTLNDSSSISNNSAFDGGGVYSFSTMILNGSSTITGNSATGNGATGNGATGNGGGVFNGSGGSLTLTGTSTITSNTAGANGGGIYDSGGTLTGAIAGPGGNVYSNTPNDIYP